MQTIQLSNGIEMPQLALGTWLIPDADAAAAVRSAIQCGYRHIDTAQAYGNERGVGEGIRTSGIDQSGYKISGVYGDDVILLNDGRWKCVRGSYVTYIE